PISAVRSVEASLTTMTSHGSPAAGAAAASATRVRPSSSASLCAGMTNEIMSPFSAAERPSSPAGAAGEPLSLEKPSCGPAQMHRLVRRLEPAIACPLRMHQLLEATVSHTLVIEQWPVTAHDLLDSRVGHDLLICLISVFTGFKDDPCKDHGFVRARLSELRKRNHAFTNQVITDAFPVIESAAFFPDPRRLL